MDPVSSYLPAMQPFRAIHAEIAACFADKEPTLFHQLWWTQARPNLRYLWNRPSTSRPEHFLPLVGIQAQILERLDLDSVPHMDDFPSSMEDFLHTVSPIFDADLLQAMADRAQRLDTISGVEMSICDVFIRRATNRAWAMEVVNAIATRYYERSSAAHRGESDLQEQDEIIPDLDLDLDLDPNLTTVQINLSGPTMLEAWNRMAGVSDGEDVVREASQVLALQALTLQDTQDISIPIHSHPWEPVMDPSIPHFHGTHASLFNTPESESYSGSLTGLSRPSRAIPALATLPVVCTGFHAFKTYLFAAFRAEVIANLFSAPLSSLQKRWTVGARHHNGVLLSRFEVGVAELTSFQVPTAISGSGAWEAQAREIEDEARRVGEDMTPSHAWRRIDGGGEFGTDWPAVLHYKDKIGNCGILGDSLAEEWLTYWSGEGIDALNRGRTGMFAVGFVKTQTRPFVVSIRGREDTRPGVFTLVMR
jgi:hypothetical protein